MSISADDLIERGYSNHGNWFLHKNHNISVNLMSYTIRITSPYTNDIERSDNDFSLDAIDMLSIMLLELR